MNSDIETIKRLLLHVPPGPRIEFGVLRGDVLAVISRHDGKTIGVDSFEGMGKPGERDVIDGWIPYPAGRLAVGMDIAASAVPRAQLIRGWVPDILDTLPDGPYAFAHIDLDHYEPTRSALAWMWDRMIPGGIICAHDWFDDRTALAAGALAEWAADHPFSGTANRHAWWIR